MSETKIRTLNPALRLVGDRDGSPERPARSVLVAAPARPGAAAAPAASAPPTGAMPPGWWTRRDAPEERVRRENIAAAQMTPTDARWVLAVRVSESLDGGKAGVLAPEKRRRLVALATRMGLRPFDANLVIAIVQDAARTGERPLGEAVSGRLALIPAPGLVPVEADIAEAPFLRRVWQSAGQALAALALAAVVLRGLISWLTGS